MTLRAWRVSGSLVVAGPRPDVQRERILTRYRGLSAVRTSVFPGHHRASGAKGCVLSGLVPSGASEADDSPPSATPGWEPVRRPGVTLTVLPARPDRGSAPRLDRNLSQLVLPRPADRRNGPRPSLLEPFGEGGVAAASPWGSDCFGQCALAANQHRDAPVSHDQFKQRGPDPPDYLPGPPSAGNWHPGSYAPDYRIYSAVWRRRIPAAKTSRMLTTPVRLRPSKTGRWRNPFVSIRWAASSVVASGLAVTGSLVIH